MLPRRMVHRPDALRDERGQALLLMLALCGVVLTGAVVLAAFGQALGAKGRHQRAADLAAMSAARVMSTAYPKLFEPAYLRPGVPNPRRLPELGYRALAKAAAVRAALRGRACSRQDSARGGRETKPDAMQGSSNERR